MPGRVGGVFVVRLEGEVLFDRAAGRFPELRELKQALRDRIAPARSLGHSDRETGPGKEMKGAMASVEIFVFAAKALAAPTAGSDPNGQAASRRLSLVIGTPERAPAGDPWHCRVALADLHRPETLQAATASRPSCSRSSRPGPGSRSWRPRAAGWPVTASGQSPSGFPPE